MEFFYLAVAPGEIPGLFDTFLGGFFVIKYIPLILQLFYLCCVLASVSLCFIEGYRPHRLQRLGIVVLAALGFLTLPFFLLQGWDELFVNLRHSKHWATLGRFSFDSVDWVEGTVDFLPYWLIGELAKFGLPLVELAYFQSFLGAVGCLGIGYCFLRRWKTPYRHTWAVVILSLYLPLAYNASHGFSSAIFSFAILGSLFLYSGSNSQKKWSYVFLSLIPLIRIEGAAFLGLIFCSEIFELRLKRPKFAWVIQWAFVIAPMVVLSLARHHFYGSAIPNPILFKQTLGSLFYFLLGVRNLISDLFCTHTISSLALIIIGFCLRVVSPKTFWKPLVWLILFILPYYSSGGDWFPSHWGRYLLPLALFSFWVAVHVLLKSLDGPRRNHFISAALILVVLPFLSSHNAFRKAELDIFKPRKVLAKLNERYSPQARINALSQLGRHLNLTTGQDQIIGSSEMATIMFFADRRAYDFLGITNREIALRPLRTPPAMLHRFTVQSELPVNIFRRLMPNLLEHYEPDILYTFDYNYRDLFEDMKFSELDPPTLIRGLRRWREVFDGLMNPLYGGVPKIIEMGYQPVVVKANRDLCALYFVHPRAWPKHYLKLKDLNYQVDKVEIVP